MDKNAEIAQNVLSAVGGKENVTSVQHCMTRLRFILKDDSIPKDDEVKKINGVLGVARSGGQYQIIIGTNVPKVYSEVCAQGGFQEKAAVEKDLDKPKEKLTAKKVLDNVMNYMSGSFTPLIPALIGAALFRTIAMVLGPSMLKLIPTDSDFYIMCDIVYDAAFYFLPIMLGYTAARKIGANPALGMTLGAALLTPDFVAMVGVRDSVNVFGFLPARVASYGQTVLPVLIAVAILYHHTRRCCSRRYTAGSRRD